jgi:hypothetical protein
VAYLKRHSNPLIKPDDECEEVVLGSIEEVMCSTTCEAHYKLLLPRVSVEALKCSMQLFISIGPQIFGTYVFAYPIIYHALNSNIYCRHHDEPDSLYTLTDCIELVKQESVGGYVGIGRILDPSWIDSSVLRQWKSTCDERHGLACRSRFSSHQQLFPDRPTWLIDVQLQCLSHAPDDVDYVALSYVWGSTNSTTASSANLEQLQRAGSLSRENGRFVLPQTIRDAMVLTDKLGERYLWVDSLCVIQDDEKLQGEELDKMASIYANTSVTIVAAQGTHADFGLRGLQSCQARTLTQNITKINRDSSIIEINHYVRKFPRYTSAWEQRGWTFQEYVFSHRLLVFDHESIHWECDRRIWHEDREDVDVQRDEETPNLFLDSRWIFTNPVPEINLFLPIVDEYLERDLTYPEDRLRAFAGMLRALESNFDGGFVCGLPVLWLDAALLWQPYDVDKSCYPRQSVGQLHSKIPSWSWAIATGRLENISPSYFIDYRQVYRDLQYHERDIGFVLQTYPVVKWAIREQVESILTMLPNTWFEYKRQAEEENRLPAGWEKHDGSASPEQQSRLNHNMYYTHDSDPEIQYSYPIPRRDGNTPTPPKGTLLSCYTKRGWVQLAETVHVKLEGINKLGDYEGIWTVVRTMDGTWAGALKYGDSEQETDPIPKSVRDVSDEPIVPHSVDTNTIELVAISRGCTVQTLPETEHWRYACPELNHDEAPNVDDEKPYEFYNCLWIEWKDGIAYRKALGRVEKSIWEGLELEEIELILG